MGTYEMTESNFTPIPEGEIVFAEIVKVDTKTWDQGTPDENTRVNFRFVVTGGGEHAGRTLFGSTPETFTTNPDCKLRAWAQEIMGLDAIPVGFKLNTDEFEGREVRVLVGYRRDRAGNLVEKDGKPVVKEFAQDVIRAAGSTAADAGEIF